MNVNVSINKKINKKEIQEMYAKGLANQEWLVKHYKELTKKYNNMFVAVYNGEVIDSDIDPRRLLSKLKERGIDISVVAIDFVTQDPLLYIL